jgi:hypothetical protein
MFLLTATFCLALRWRMKSEYRRQRHGGNIVRREIAEPIYRDMLRQMNDEALESAARGWVWLCETSFEGPWPEDQWHRDCIREEFERREKLDIFLRAEQKILIQLGKAPKQSL